MQRKRKRNKTNKPKYPIWPKLQQKAYLEVRGLKLGNNEVINRLKIAITWKRGTNKADWKKKLAKKREILVTFWTILGLEKH